MRIDVLFLGPAKDFANAETVFVDLPEGASVAQLRRRLVEQYPGLREAMVTIRLAVNEAFAGDETVLHDGDQVALIPPVSGGTGGEGMWVELVTGPIPVRRVREFMTGDTTLGGIVTFEGVTRAAHEEGHGLLTRLDYVAYESMAMQELRRLAGEVKGRWSPGRLAIIHRLGSVPPGEASVMIAVACAHRAESFEACRYLIDSLKKDVPIWKQDVFEDGFTRWVEPARASRQPQARNGPCHGRDG